MIQLLEQLHEQKLVALRAQVEGRLNSLQSTMHRIMEAVQIADRTINVDFSIAQTTLNLKPEFLSRGYLETLPLLDKVEACRTDLIKQAGTLFRNEVNALSATSEAETKELRKVRGELSQLPSTRDKRLAGSQQTLEQATKSLAEQSRKSVKDQEDILFSRKYEFDQESEGFGNGDGCCGGCLSTGSLIASCVLVLAGIGAWITEKKPVILLAPLPALLWLFLRFIVTLPKRAAVNSARRARDIVAAKIEAAEKQSREQLAAAHQKRVDAAEADFHAKQNELTETVSKLESKSKLTHEAGRKMAEAVEFLESGPPPR